MQYDDVTTNPIWHAERRDIEKSFFFSCIAASCPINVKFRGKK